MGSNGIILLDSALRPLRADPESVRILAYPNSAGRPEALDGLLSERILSFLDPAELRAEGFAVAQFQSGKRLYLCRAFLLTARWDPAPCEISFGLVFERGLTPPPADRAGRPHAAPDPFGFSPDPKAYCFTRAHRDVLAALRTVILKGRGAAALLGQAGMGKTTLLQYLAVTLRRECDFAHLSGSFPDRGALARAALGALGIGGAGGSGAENLRVLERGLIERTLSGRRAAVVCDNAQDLDAESLENLCSLAELELGGKGLLPVILAGRPGLIEKLSAGPVGGRIGLYCRLTPMDAAETRGYVLHRLRLAGGAQMRFTSFALDRVVVYSRGIPLTVNMLCRHSLSLAGAIGLPVVDERIVEDSAYDLVLGSQTINPWDGRESSGAARAKPHLHLVKK